MKQKRKAKLTFVGQQSSQITPYRPYRTALFESGKKAGRPRSTGRMIQMRATVSQAWADYYEHLRNEVDGKPRTHGEMLLSCYFQA